jgi:hypothetical protein
MSEDEGRADETPGPAGVPSPDGPAPPPGAPDSARPAGPGRRAGEPAAGPARTAPGPAVGGGAGDLLGELSGLRRRARAARHAYWFPLVLFGVLTVASAPLYTTAQPGVVPGQAAPVTLLALGGGRHLGLPVYWLFALTGGYWVSAAWYRWHARRAGVATPSRAFLVTGIALTAVSILAFAVPLTPLGISLIPRPLVLRGAFPFGIIAVGLWVLARAERSRGLAVIAVVYTAAALLAALYNVENIVFRLGWVPGPGQYGLTALPGVLLTAVILLAAGLAALALQRPGRRAGPAPAGTSS